MIDEIWILFALIIGFVLWPVSERILLPMVMERLGWEKKRDALQKK